MTIHRPGPTIVVRSTFRQRSENLGVRWRSESSSVSATRGISRCRCPILNTHTSPLSHHGHSDVTNNLKKGRHDTMALFFSGQEKEKVSARAEVPPLWGAAATGVGDGLRQRLAGAALRQPLAGAAGRISHWRGRPRVNHWRGRPHLSQGQGHNR